MTHYLEDELRRLQADHDNELWAAERQEYRGDPRPRKKAVLRVVEPPASKPPPCGCIAAGLRATRLMENRADFDNNPADFRCPACNRILDAPVLVRH